MRLIDADELMESIRKALGIKSMTKSLLLPAERTIIDQIDNAKTIGGWISVKDRLPQNADHLNAFCPRYFVQTKYGISEGWYNPNKGCWYTLVWFLIGRYTEDDIDMERGDIPRISNKIEVTHWMPMPEPAEEATSWME